jgi:hypothetical protein
VATVPSRQPLTSLTMRQETGALVLFPIRKPAVVLGSDMTCDIILNYPGILRYHACLTWDGERFMLEDLNSTTGTLLNGTPITNPQPLKSGDAIAIGKALWLRFEVHPAAVFPEELLYPVIPTGAESVAATAFQPPGPEPGREEPAAAPATGEQPGPRRRFLFVGLGCLLVVLVGVALILLLLPLFPTLPASLAGRTLPSGAVTPASPLTAPPPLPLALCADRYGPDFAFVVDLEIHRPPDRPDEPPPHQPFVDPTFHTCIARVTNRAADIGSGDGSVGMRNGHAHVNAFNADNSLLLARSSNFSWYLYEVATLQLVRQVAPQGEIDPRWDARNPALFYITPDVRINSFDLRDEAETQLHDFTRDLPGYGVDRVWGRYSSNPSQDSRYWVFVVAGKEVRTLALLTYDNVSKEVLGLYDLRNRLPEGVKVRSATMSQRGTHVVAYYSSCGRELGTYDRPCGLMIYSPDLKSGQGVAGDVGAIDVALDPQGREVVVYQDNAAQTISMLDLETKQPTPLYALDRDHLPLGLDICGRAIYRPGWVLLSAYDRTPDSHSWLDDQVLALELVPQGRVVHLAHTHSLVDPGIDFHLRGEPQASTNADFTRVLFTSNWGRMGSGELEMYVIELPPDWTERLPEQVQPAGGEGEVEKMPSATLTQ